MNDNRTFDSDPPRAALRDSVVRKLLESIMLGKIEAGARLVATELSDRFGVSATPVREAIVELGGLGMVCIRHNRGAHVLEFGRTQLAEYFHIRRLFECEAARLSCGNIPPDALSELRAQMNSLPKAYDAWWVAKASALDIAVHRKLREHCGNNRLILELDRYTVMGEAVRVLLDESTPAMRESFPTIATVVNAIEKKCSATVVSAMHEHISIIARIAEKLLFDGRTTR